MTIQMKVSGIKEAQKFLKSRAEILEGTRGQFYQKQTKVIQRTIDQKCDACYVNSPAKEIALQSAETWKHSGHQHINEIFSTDYAAFKQYRCGQTKFAWMLHITDNAKQEMLYAALEELGSPGI